jgi:hypothetical protein
MYAGASKQLSSRVAGGQWGLASRVEHPAPLTLSVFPTVSICCCLFILFLFLSELTGFITTEV